MGEGSSPPPMTCPGCNGTGSFQIRDGSGTWITVKCLQCRGTGRLPQCRAN